MLLSKTPDLQEGYKILIHLDNPHQQEIMEKIYNKMLFFLRHELLNDTLSLQTKMMDEKEEENNGKRKLYTDDDKFKHLQQKNQMLQKLKKDFDLDFDF